jgi:TolB protein
MRHVPPVVLTLAMLACGDSTPSTSLPPPPPSDARLVAFSTNRGTQGYHGASIYTMHADGSEKQRVTSEGFFDGLPAWSPDGSRIVFNSSRDPAGLWVMSADGSSPHAIVTGLDTHGYGARWSPDGLQFAFTARVGNALFVYISDTAGANVRRLTSNGGSDLTPAWSPDGSHIVYAVTPSSEYAIRTSSDYIATDSSDSIDIYVSRADGSDQQRLTMDGRSAAPDWSPDGTQIAFHRADSLNTLIFVMRADGTGAHALTHIGSSYAPTWSPDGLQLEFSASLGGTNQIFRVNADGTGGTQLTFPPTTSQFPAWKPTL